MSVPRSPFPGMDPYLEAPRLWPGFHDSLLTYLRDDLQSRLPAPYYADLQDRVFLEQDERWIVPDVRVSRKAGPAKGGASAAPAEGASPAVMVEVPEFEVRQPFLEIRDTRTGHHVVTVIEVLSPDNKRPGSEGAQRYRGEQAEISRSDTSLVEIDLLRAGAHVVAVPQDRLPTRPPHEYRVVVRRGTASNRREVYPIGLRDALPKVAVPLGRNDRDLVVALQTLVDHAYAGGAYWKRIDYSVDPDPPLAHAHAGWARKRIAGGRG